MIKTKQKTRDIYVNKETFSIFLEFLLGFILTKTVIFFSVLPLGISYALANNIKNKRLYAMIGAFFGYLLMSDTTYGFRYAGVILIISALLYLTKINVYVLVATVLPTFSIINMLLTEVKIENIVLIVCEVTICMTTLMLYTKFLEKDAKYQKVCLLFISATVISALSSISIFLNIVPIRIVAVLAILLTTYFGKNGTGCVTSVVLGIAMDSSLGVHSAIFTLAYSFASVIAGSLANMNKIIFSVVFVSMYGVAGIFGVNSDIFLASVIEVIIANIIFVLTPIQKFSFLKDIFRENDTTHKFSTEKLSVVTSSASSILSQMGKVLSESIDKVNPVDFNDINKVYVATTEKICKKCELSYKCWNIDYPTSIDALNGATSKAIKRGYFNSTDFATHFSSRCINFIDFLTCINEGVFDLAKQQAINKTLQTNKEVISNQCTAISAILNDISYTIADPVEAFPHFEEEIQDKMKKYSLGLTVLVYNNSAGKFFVEIIGKNTFEIIKNINGATRIVSVVVGKNMEFISQVVENTGSRIIFGEKNIYKMEIGTKEIAKHRICGDIIDIFDNDSGGSFIVLADGMGSGRRANKESLQVVDLLAKMLKSGVSLTKSLNGIAPLVSIKNDDKNFVALDVLSVDLMTLEGNLAKYGASPSYIFRGGLVHRVSSSNLPLGICFDVEISKIKLMYEDVVVMISDGILDSVNDAFIVDILKNSENKSCDEICNEILYANDTDDDKTVIVIRINLNK
ncbi:MAG: PP2C family serine/threonine-protein phosphatase [Clostridia bacterium]